jgi:hypothetical protein
MWKRGRAGGSHRGRLAAQLWSGAFDEAAFLAGAAAACTARDKPPFDFSRWRWT